MHANLRIVVLKSSVHCHVLNHIPKEIVHFTFLHKYSKHTTSHTSLVLPMNHSMHLNTS